MKSEICAEVTAKVAYSVRIMLDHFGDEMRTTLEAYYEKNVGEEGQCSCKDLKKCQSCKEKRALLRASHYAFKKEEKKAAKMAYKESKKLRKKYLKSSDSESESEFPTADKNIHQIDGGLSKPVVKAPPIPPRNISPVKVVGLNFAPLFEASAQPEATVKEHVVNIAVESELKIINGSSAPLEEISACETNTVVNAEKNTSDHPLNASSTHAESYPSPSDSEFEVVSMPLNVDMTPEPNRGKFHKLIISFFFFFFIFLYFLISGGDDYPSISDYEDNSSSSGDENETETEIEFNSNINSIFLKIKYDYKISLNIFR